MTIVTVVNLNNLITNTVLDIARIVASDNHRYPSTSYVHPEQQHLKVRNQANGYHVVNKQGQFTTTTKEEKEALIAIFEDAMAQATPASQVVSAGGLMEGYSHMDMMDDVTFDTPVYVKTDVPRRMRDGYVQCHWVSTNDLAEYCQVRNAYQLREWHMGHNKWAGNVDWMENAVLEAEADLLNLGFNCEMINKARAIVQDNVGYSNTRFAYTFEIWDVYMRPWREVAYNEQMAEVEKPDHTLAVTFITDYCRNQVNITKIDNYIRRVYEWAMRKADKVDCQCGWYGEDKWFATMCEFARALEPKLRRHLDPMWCNDSDLWKGYAQYLNDMFWFYHKPVSIWNQVCYEQRPAPQQWKAIKQLMWLDQVACDDEVHQQNMHTDHVHDVDNGAWQYHVDINKEFSGEAAELTRLVDVYREITDLECMQRGMRENRLWSEGVRPWKQHG